MTVDLPTYPASHSASPASEARCPVDHHGYDAFAMTNPFEAYVALREEAPVIFEENIGYFVVSRYADIKAVFDNWQAFSSENAQAPVRPRGLQATQIMNEGGFTAYSGLSARIPPEHTRIRMIVQRAFTPRRYKVLEPAIRENTARLLQRMLASPKAEGDFLRDVATDIPTVTILSLLGVGAEMVPTYKRWSESRAAMTWGDLTDDEQVPHAHNLVEYWAECQNLVANAHQNGGDDLVADLVKAQGDGAEISDHEIASVCYSLLFAGHETTTTLISNTIRELLSHPEQWQKIVRDPRLIPAAIEETLRYSPSIVGWRRKAVIDSEIGGVTIAAGSNILLLMGSANRDSEIFDDPEVFDISRPNSRNHLSFGFGIHYCLGNILAKLQDKIVVEETVKAVPSLRIVDPGTIVFGDNLSFRAPTSVPVTWSVAS